VTALCVKWAFQLQEVEQIPPTAHHVLLALADRFNGKYDAAWPSYADICRRTGLSERTVARAVDELEARNLVRREPRLSSSGRKIGTIYRFPRYSDVEASVRNELDFDEHGKYDEQAAAENIDERGNIYDSMFSPGAGVVTVSGG
jgi:DNA-binding transcriptional MocR family regulator